MSEIRDKEDQKSKHSPGMNQGEREFEIGKDEAWFANVKRTYDEYQEMSLESQRRNRSHIDKMLSDAQQFDNQRQVIANQALQNSVESANMEAKRTIENRDYLSKQALRHTDLAVDRQWNIDEVAHLIANTSVFKDAIASAVAQVALMVADKKEEK